MSNKFKRAISILLAVVMMLSVCVGTVSAKEYSGYTRYLSLGDSMASGCGLPDNPLLAKDQPDKTKIYCPKTKLSYPTLLAEDLGISDEDYVQLGTGGMRTTEIRALLDSSYTVPDKYVKNFSGNELEEYITSKYDVEKLVAESDIITISIGGNDIMSTALYRTQAVLEQAGISRALINSLIGEYCRNGQYIKALGAIFDYSETVGLYSKVLQSAIFGLTDGLSTSRSNWEAICKRIYELNPDVVLVCIGCINPVHGVKLTSKSLLSIGTALDSVFDSMNNWFKKGSSYSDRYAYVDITDVETILESKGKSMTDSGCFDNLLLNIHPTIAGHRDIANRILNAIPERCAPVQNDVSLLFKVTKAVKSKLKSIFRK